MATPWSQVTQSAAYQALSPDQREQARQQYFQQVVAPQISDPSQVDAAKRQFDAATSPSSTTFGKGVEQAAQDMRAQDASDQARDNSVVRQIGNSFANTGANLIKGAGGLIDLPIDLLNSANERLGGAPNYFKTIHGLVDQGTQGAGIPQDTSGAGQMAGAITRGIGGVVGGMGVGSGMAGGQSQAAQAIGNTLLARPGAQIAAATAGSIGAEGARQMGLSPGAQMGAALVGGMMPTAATAAGQGMLGATRAALSSASPEVAALAEKAAANGIPLKASQVSGSTPLKIADSVTAKLPLSGAKAFQDQQQTAFNRAVASTIGEDADKITPEVFARARNRIGDEFDRLTSNNSVPIDRDLMDKFRAVAQEAAASFGPDAASMVNKQVLRLVSQSQNGSIPGRVLQSVDSSLGRAMRAGGENSIPLGDLQETLRNAMEKNIRPEDAQAWATARQQWRDLKTIEPLVSKDTVGDVSPAQLMGRVTADRSGKAAMARGSRGDLGDLARIGKQFLRDPIPDSGTAGRLMTMDALKGLGGVLGGAVGAGTAINPVAGIGTLGGAIAGGRMVQSALQNPALVNALLGKDPQTLNALLGGLRTSVNPTAAALQSRSAQ